MRRILGTRYRAGKTECEIPRMKGEQHFTINQQLLKIREELDEAIQAPKEYQAEELGDVLHATLVLIRLMYRDGIRPNQVIQMAIQKNRRRRYYDESDSY